MQYKQVGSGSKTRELVLKNELDRPSIGMVNESKKASPDLRE